MQTYIYTGFVAAGRKLSKPRIRSGFSGPKSCEILADTVCVSMSWTYIYYYLYYHIYFSGAKSCEILADTACVSMSWT